jgi:hypothetical protein
VHFENQEMMTFRPNSTPERDRYLVAVLAIWLAAMSSGCQGYRPNLTQNGSLKAGYSQVQFENETLKAKLAKLEKQNRMLVADLQREESHSGTLAARLDESRNLLKRNGLNLPLDEENPRMVARADQGRSNRTTFGQVQPNKGQRRSKYADPEEPAETESSEPDFPANESGQAKSKRKALQPPSFPEDPPASGEEVPEVSMNDVSTGWRRLGYRDYREMTREPAGDFKTP